MEQKRNVNKTLNLLIGFVGWFLVSSLIVLISDLGWFNEFLTPVVTIIAIGILLFRKRNWLAYGVVAAVIANIFGFFLIFGLFFGDGIGLLLGMSLRDIIETIIVGMSYPFFMVGGFY